MHKKKAKKSVVINRQQTFGGMDRQKEIVKQQKEAFLS